METSYSFSQGYELAIFIIVGKGCKVKGYWWVIEKGEMGQDRKSSGSNKVEKRTKTCGWVLPKKASFCILKA